MTARWSIAWIRRGTGKEKMKRIMDIEPTHAIFQSDAYREDFVAFQLLESICQGPALRISDGASFIIGAADVSAPIWIWTRNSISRESIQDLLDVIEERFLINTQVSFVTKTTITDVLLQYLIRRRYDCFSRLQMEAYVCERVIPPRGNVCIDHPVQSDLEEIAVCMQEFQRDCFGEKVSIESMRKRADVRMKKPLFFIIRQDGHVAATAQGARETSRYIALNQVYTRPEYRGRGYASALAAHISSCILKRGKLPMLYADRNNPFSNRAYQSVGFVPCGKIDEIRLTMRD